MTRLSWKLLIAIAAVLLLALDYDCILTIWVGSTDLDVEFVLSEAGTGKPLPGAQVEVQSSSGFYRRPDKPMFVLFADTSGVARKECGNCMCGGARSGLGFTDTFAVHLPSWRFRVSAPGFESSEWVDLDVVEYQEAAIVPALEGPN